MQMTTPVLYQGDINFLFERFTVTVYAKTAAEEGYQLLVDGGTTVLRQTGTVWTSPDLPDGLSMRIGSHIEKAIRTV